MSLKHILLGILDQPHSGYGIKLEFDRVFNHFWSAELAQIYPALDRLEKEGLAASKQQASEKGPSRRVYKRSAKGTRELTRWLESGPVIGQDRLSYLAQVFFLSDLCIQERIGYFKKLRHNFAKELEALQVAEEEFSQAAGYPDNLSDHYQCQQFTLRLGLKKLEGNIQWCDECLEVLQAAEAQRLQETA